MRIRRTNQQIVTVEFGSTKGALDRVGSLKLDTLCWATCNQSAFSCLLLKKTTTESRDENHAHTVLCSYETCGILKNKNKKWKQNITNKHNPVTDHYLSP